MVLLSNYLLGVIVAQSQFKNAIGAQFLQTLVHINGDFIVVLVCFVAQAKYLQNETITIKLF